MSTTTRYKTHRVISSPPYRDEITDKFNAKARSVMSDPGSASFDLLKVSPHYGLTEDDVIVHSIDGHEFFSELVEKIDQTTVSSGEEAEQKTTFSGRSILGETDRARIYPILNHNPFGDVRYFDFSTPELDITGWGKAVQRFQQCRNIGYLAQAPPNGLFGAPIAWPDTSAYWISPNALSGNSDPVGFWYARKHFYLDAQYDMVFYVAADDAIDLRLDGLPIVGFDSGLAQSPDDWAKTHYVRLTVSPGDHVLAAKVQNYSRAFAGNMTALIVAAYYIGDTWGGNTQTLLFHTDSSWDTLAYPALAPGFSPLRIIEILFNEAQIRGILIPWILNWTPGGATDSAGTPVPTTGDVSFRYGDTILDALNQLGDGYIEFRARTDPSGIGRVLDAYVARDVTQGGGHPGMGADRTLSIAPGVNATAMEHVRDISKLNSVVMFRDFNGYSEVITNDAGLLNIYGRREGFLSLNDTKDRPTAFNTAFKSLVETTATDTVTAEQWAADASVSPPNAYDLGDRITSLNSYPGSPGRDLVPQQMRVVGISVEEPVAGGLHVVPEMVSPLEDQAKAIERWLSRTANGTLDGRSSAATPGPINVIDSGTSEDIHLDWSQPDNAAVGMGTPQSEVRPVKMVALEMKANSFRTDMAATATTWVLTKNNQTVASMTLPSNSLDLTVCFVGEVHGVPGDVFNAGCIAAGSHSGVSFLMHNVYTD